METVARTLLKLKKWAGIVSTISWIVFLLVLGAAMALHAFGTLIQVMYENLFLPVTGLLAGGFPLAFFLLWICFFPHDEDRSFQEQATEAAMKALRVIVIFAIGVAVCAAVLAIMSEPLIAFSRWMYHELLPFGKSISKIFTAIWAGLMIICLIFLIRLRSVKLALEIAFDLLQESIVEIVEFYRDAYEYVRHPGATEQVDPLER